MPNNDAESPPAGLEFQHRIDALCQELEVFKNFLVKVKKDEKLWMSGFKKTQRQLKAAHSSFEGNFIHNESLWLVAKTCPAITSLRHHFEMFPRDQMKNRKDNEHIKASTTIVDIVYKNGSEWARVNNITAKTAIREFVNAGYGMVDSDSDEDDEGIDDPTGLLAQAKSLNQASKLVIHRGQHPRLKLFLPRFRMDELKALNLGNPNLILRVFDRLKVQGITVEIGSQPPTPVKEVLHRMTSPDYSTITNTLNIDTTILLAMISDISHVTVGPEDWHNQFISAQIEREREVKLLPLHIWPICGTRKLVCTREALEMMQKIVDGIGTEAERRRAALLFEMQGDNLSTEERISEFQTLSEYNIPDGWSIPIKVVDVNIPGK